MKVNTDLLANLTLRRGLGNKAETGVCLMQAITIATDGRLFGGAPSDHPTCVAQSLIRAGQRLNDTATEAQRARLKTLIPRLIGTRDDGRDDVRLAAALSMADEVRSFWTEHNEPSRANWPENVTMDISIVMLWATLGEYDDHDRYIGSFGWELAYSIFDRILRAGETLVNDEAFGVSAAQTSTCVAV